MIFLAPPDFANDFGQLLQMAEKILADRQRDYPDLVEQGAMTDAQADDGLRIAGAIVADYRRIVALRDGRPADPIDTAASTADKWATLRYVHQRALKQRDAAIEDLRHRWRGSGVAELIDQGLIDWPVILDQWKREAIGWKFDEVREYLSATRRTWATGALHENACDWPWPMVYAEIQAQLIARDSRRAQAA